MPIKIALAGNPNCGKTTMFNDLTGSSQYVGNWPGVTVEKKEGKLKGHKDVTIVDLPGIYSLSPYTLEEVVTRNFLLDERPDVIINLVDGSNIERNLYLTTQLVEIGIPVIIALNMMDIVKKNGDVINIKKLGDALGCEVIETSAVKGLGSKEVANRAVSMAAEHAVTVPQHSFSKDVESALEAIGGAVSGKVPEANARWYSIKLFERDREVMKNVKLPQEVRDTVEQTIAACEAKQDDDSESIITNERYTYIGGVTKACLHKKKAGMTTSDKIDRVVTNRWLALPIFVIVMTAVYYISITIGTMGTDWINDELFGKILPEATTSWFESAGVASWLQNFVINGVYAGVGTVIGFLPQIILLFLFIAILEDCGYMARVAFIMDRIFRKFGLSGKSFIPVMIGSGCGVPAIMASRTIENAKDRKMTIMLTTFIPCSAKTVIVAMIVSTFFPNQPWMAPAMYLLGIAVIIISGIILKKTRIFAGDPAPFVMELPQYHIPGAKGVLIHMWDRSKAFIIKAGTIIFVVCTLIWFLSSYGWNLQEVDVEQSMLATIGHGFAWFFAPLGFGDWKGAVATISALAAKENAISTLAILNGVSDAGDTQAVMTGISSMFTALSAFSFMIFNLFCPPCVAAMAATRREMGSGKWAAIAIGYQVMVGYALAFLSYQFGSVLFYGAGFGVGTAIAILVLAVILYFLFRKAKTGNEHSLKNASAA